jgi:hypothetical protein
MKKCRALPNGGSTLSVRQMARNVRLSPCLSQWSAHRIVAPSVGAATIIQQWLMKSRIIDRNRNRSAACTSRFFSQIFGPLRGDITVETVVFGRYKRRCALCCVNVIRVFVVVYGARNFVAVRVERGWLIG